MKVPKSVNMEVAFWEYVDSQKLTTGKSKNEIIVEMIFKGLEFINPELLEKLKEDKR